jgi:hypothetical protein
MYNVWLAISGKDNNISPLLNFSAELTDEDSAAAIYVGVFVFYFPLNAVMNK